MPGCRTPAPSPSPCASRPPPPPWRPPAKRPEGRRRGSAVEPCSPCNSDSESPSHWQPDSDSDGLLATHRASTAAKDFDSCNRVATDFCCCNRFRVDWPISTGPGGRTQPALSDGPGPLSLSLFLPPSLSLSLYLSPFLFVSISPSLSPSLPLSRRVASEVTRRKPAGGRLGLRQWSDYYYGLSPGLELGACARLGIMMIRVAVRFAIRVGRGPDSEPPSPRVGPSCM